MLGLSGGGLTPSERQLQIEAGALMWRLRSQEDISESSEVGLPYYRSVAKRAMRALDASENWPAKSALCVVEVLSRALAKFLKLESVEASVREKVLQCTLQRTRARTGSSFRHTEARTHICSL